MRARLPRSRVSATALTAALLLVACDGEDPVGPVQEYRLPIQVLKLRGDSGVALVNQPADPYVVQVVAADGSILSGVIIDWVAEEGAGSIDHVRDTTRVLNPMFEIDPPAAMAVHWLGPEEGYQRVTAVASELPGAPRATFEARAVRRMVIVQSGYGCEYYYYCYADVAFAPDRIVVGVGETVAWRWQCSAWYWGENCPVHDVTFEDDPTEPVSSPGKTYGWHLRTFDQAGEYRYRSVAWSESFQTGMVGSVRVR